MNSYLPFYFTTVICYTFKKNITYMKHFIIVITYAYSSFIKYGKYGILLWMWNLCMYNSWSPRTRCPLKITTLYNSKLVFYLSFNTCLIKNSLGFVFDVGSRIIGITTYHHYNIFHEFQLLISLLGICCIFYPFYQYQHRLAQNGQD